MHTCFTIATGSKTYTGKIVSEFGKSFVIRQIETIQMITYTIHAVPKHFQKFPFFLLY